MYSFLLHKCNFRLSPLTATTFISKSVDPLWTLIQVSQNLPSHAYALSNVTISENIRTFTKGLSRIPIIKRSEVDGRGISVERLSFNLFGLFNVLREENNFLDNIQSTMQDYLKPKEALQVAVSLISMGERLLWDLMARLELALRMLKRCI